VAGEETSLSPALHAYRNLVDQSGGELVCAADREKTTPSAFRSTRELEIAIRQYISHPNQQAKPFRWTKTADQILASIARFCSRTSETGR
jgi:hypothetical protein